MEESKLIRDKMGRSIGLGPGDSVRLVKDNEEYEQRLIEKLQEEYMELRKELVKNDQNPDLIIEEAGDLIEVIRSIVYTFSGLDFDDLLQEMEVKRQSRGGFEAGIVLERKA